jgi:L-lactate dehydrogenase complex protein LldF
MKNADSFLKDADSKTFDPEHRRKINFNIGRYNDAVAKGTSQFDNHELGRQRASYLKTQVIENLDKYLIEFEANFTRNGGKVIWARDGAEALK